MRRSQKHKNRCVAVCSQRVSPRTCVDVTLPIAGRRERDSGGVALTPYQPYHFIILSMFFVMDANAMDMFSQSIYDNMLQTDDQ